jgi:sphingomyelin phosphodiesterase acid-like 3
VKTRPALKLLSLLHALSMVSLIALTAVAPAQTALKPALKPVVLLSDIHFDPFHDPAKFAQLEKTDTRDWLPILTAPATPTQAEDFAKLQNTCNAKGVDTPFALLQAAMKAAHTQQPNPFFVTVSGDLMAHQFDCRFHTLDPKATEADYSAFAAKTVAFVSQMLTATFPGAPVYLALGNNDSGCKDYDEDPNSAFLQADAQTAAAAARNPAERAAILASYSQFGDMSVALPAPMQHTRLLVMQDIFESRKYAACSGGKAEDNVAPGAQQIAWLRAQLAKARAAHQTVWIMAHIPPGIDAYSTFTKGADVCTGGKPEAFLNADALADALEQYGDIVRLALFGHTHMDEMRLYKTAAGALVPGKLVPSITAVNGNNPAFTVAQVNPKTATLVDYTVFAAGTDWATDPTFAREYTFSTTYNQPNLSGASMARLMDAFLTDRTGSADLSLDYQKFFYAGDPMASSGAKGAAKAAAMKLVWPMYACAMTQPHTDGFKACMCPAKP